MLTYNPRPYQTIGYNYIWNNPFSGLLLDMGLGKTVTVLTAASDMLALGEIQKPLIVAPKLVASHTWPSEIKKWAHLQHLTYSVIEGTAEQRLAAYRTKADIYIISRDNFTWLVSHTWKKWKFDFVGYDESSSFKNPDSLRFKAARKIRPYVKRSVILTGTPIPNGLLDLWPQIFMLDQGERLFKTVTNYRDYYFYPVIREGHVTRKYDISEINSEKIYAKISDICLSMKAKDWLEVPERQDIIVDIELDNYDEFLQFKEDAVLELKEKQLIEITEKIGITEDQIFWSEDEQEIKVLQDMLNYLQYLLANPTVITAVNAGVLYNKLLQYANGAVYDDNKNYHVVHDKKLDSIAEAVEALQGKPVIIFYQFQSDIDRIKARIPGITVLKSPSQIDDWNEGKIKVLLAHPASTGHGLNLQYGGNYIFWFGLPHSLELWLQAIARLERQGQKYVVMNYLFIIKGTPEYRVHKALIKKTLTQDKLIEALK